MHVVVATHGHCFDGLASAVLFSRLVRQVDGKATTFAYRGCGYGANQATATPDLLSGDGNAILDYRFTATESLTWYFDHHRTAFAGDAEREAFEALRGTGRAFFDDGYTSCTKLIADVGRERFGFEAPELAEMIRWADTIDSAGFESAEHAVSRTEPVMRLASVVEHHGDDAFLARMVPKLLEKPLSEVASSRAIEERFAPLGAKHERFIERVRTKARALGRVVFVDLTDTVVETVGKFVTYALYPESVYSVIVGKMKSGVKISVGYNPWCGQELDTDISAICARHGGGGHRAVGGIAFPSRELDRAVAVATDICRELGG